MAAPAIRGASACRYPARRSGEHDHRYACARTARPRSAWWRTWAAPIRKGARFSASSRTATRSNVLRLDRVEEFLLFLYSHRFHDHTPGSWTAGEVSGIGGGTAIFCIPAQQTIPLLVRWMYALEDSDADRLYLAKGHAARMGGLGADSVDRPRAHALGPRVVSR